MKETMEKDTAAMTSSELHKEKGRRRRSVLRSQRTAIIVLAIVFVVLCVAIPLIFKYVINVNTFTDVDGEKYKLKAVGGVWALYDLDGNKMDVTTDGYYVTAKASTLLKIDKDTGDYEIVGLVDTEEGESVGTSQRLLMFNHTSQENTQSVEVHNQYGTFTFYRDANNTIQLKGYEGTPYSQTMMASLFVSCGYTLTLQKIQNPIKNDAGEYAEYGLAKEVRKDADGKDYNYDPAWYRMTDINGKTYTVIVGDETPSGNGYYVRYTGRDAVYIMDYSVEGSMIAMYDTDKNVESVKNILDLPVERFVTPVIVYPMTLTTYFDVSNFMIIPGEEYRKSKADSEYQMQPFVCFSFSDMDSRFGTFYHSRSYNLQIPKGYLANTEATDATLQSLYGMNFVGVTKLGVTDADMTAYGLDDPEYVIYYVFHVTDEKTGKVHDLEQLVPVSKKTARGTYYVGSCMFDMICEVPDTSMLFLEYKLIDWVDSEYFDMYLAYGTEVEVKTKDGTDVLFTLDNSRSDSMSNATWSEKAQQNNSLASDKMVMHGRDAAGNEVDAFSAYTITDQKGFTWTITADKITAVNAEGTKCDIEGLYHSYNALGDTVAMLSGRIVGVNGDTVESITPDYVLITDKNGHSTKYLRYGMSIFRKFYQSLLYASLEGDVHDGFYGLTDEKIAEYCASPDEKADVIIRVKTNYDDIVKLRPELKDNPYPSEYVYRFYQYSERHSMITVDGGTGEFYVLRSFTDKIVEDAGRVIRGEAVAPTTKY